MRIISKKNKIIVASAIVVALSIPAGVYAIMSATSNKEVNIFKSGYINAAVVENNKLHEDSTSNVEEYKSLRKSGDKVAKVVTIKNTADNENATSMYARVKLIPTIVGDANSEFKGSVLGGDIKISYDLNKTNNWKVKDNTYYYTLPIKQGITSDVLMNGVTIHQDIPEGYHLELKVMVDAIVTRPTSLIEETWGIKADFSDLATIH